MSLDHLMACNHLKPVSLPSNIRGDIICTSQITNTFDMIQVDTTVLQKASRQKKPLIYEV